MPLAELAPIASGGLIANELAAAIEACRAALAVPEMRETAAALRSQGIAASDCVAMIEQVGRQSGAADRIADFRKVISKEAASAATLERYLLLETVAQFGARLSGLRMSESVLRCLADELRFLAAPSVWDSAKLLAPTDGFIAMAKIVTLRRFPAGQLHVERSGIPLSWFARPDPRRLTSLLVFLARHVRGRGPFFFYHVAWRRKNRMFLSETEQNRSYYRIAQSLALHPEVKGLMTESWLHSPDTARVSPHLAWFNEPFAKHGGLIVILGEAGESSGVFTGGSERKKLYDEGKFRPTTAMAIWPRAAFIEWAENHPELADG
jgi:hypothetical protein